MEQSNFDWSEYHRVARELSVHGDECYLRTSISRAYYYAYHLGRERIISNRFFVSRSDAHKQIWEKFSGSPDHRCLKLAQTAQRLKEKRESADYDSRYSQAAKDAPAMVTLSAQFAANLAALESHLPRNTGVTVP